MSLSLIPIVGDIIHLFKDFSLSKRLIESNSKDEQINLLKTKDKYSYVGAARSIIMVALIIAEIVLGIFNPISGAICICIFTASMGIHLSKILQNASYIKQLESGQSVKFY